MIFLDLQKDLSVETFIGALKHEKLLEILVYCS
jgi:hypothetical protein